jgi:hypothetical protein
VPSLADYPHLVAQLDRRKNGPIVPEDVTYASNKKLWWRCPEGPDHLWEAVIAKRTTEGKGCPFCAGQRVSVTNALSRVAPRLARQWHPTKNGDLRPRDVTAGSRREVWWKCPEAPDHEWCTKVSNRAAGGRGCPFCRGYRASASHNLAVAAPHLIAEWHPTRNGALRPQDLPPYSNKIVWWKCPEGSDHVWSANVSSRTYRDGGCPFCAGKRVSVTNALSRVAPWVARQWHPAKNGDLRPRDVTAGSKRAIWWKCPMGQDHVWRAQVVNRVHGGTGCPFCSRLRPTASRNLAITSPRLLAEWHPTKNGALRPQDLTPRSNQLVWWKCARGHAWEAPPHRRAKGAGCPYCSGHLVAPELSLAAKNPALAKQWHPTKNGALTPREVAPVSGKRVWWKCRKGPDHEWEASVSDRKDRGCPFCAGRRVSVTNSLAAVRPDIAAQWHPTKNGKLTPADVTAGTDHRAWWKCPEGPDHEWDGIVANRNTGFGCPFCAGKRVSVTNSLATTERKIAKEWHPTKNAPLTPRDVTRGTGRRVWWRCAFGHEWIRTVNARTSKGAGCPECRRIPGSQAAAATTFKRRRQVRFTKYEGARHGPVRHVR